MLRFWIEKTIVAGRADREEGDHALGRALWSPQASKDGKNIYSNMLQVQPGDVIFHLTDNEAITGVSIASGAADADFVGLNGSDWAGQPGYRIALVDHEQLSPPLARSAFLDTEPFATELRELAATGAKGLFYNRSRGSIKVLIRLHQKTFSRVQLHRNNAEYDLLLRIAELAFDCLLSDGDGTGYKFYEVLRDERKNGDRV